MNVVQAQSRSWSHTHIPAGLCTSMAAAESEDRDKESDDSWLFFESYPPTLWLLLTGGCTPTV